jgi:hypothetical protein
VDRFILAIHDSTSRNKYTPHLCHEPHHACIQHPASNIQHPTSKKRKMHGTMDQESDKTNKKRKANIIKQEIRFEEQ